MAELTITVHGTPAPQGSKRAFVGKSGRAHVIESSHDRVKSWRQAVIDEARAELTLDSPLEGPVELYVCFWLKRPKSHYRTGRNSHLLRDAAPPHPHGMPDLSKLIRSTEDALTAVGVWADDAQVVICQAVKQWCPAGQPPGAHITIREIWEQEP